MPSEQEPGQEQDSPRDGDVDMPGGGESRDGATTTTQEPREPQGIPHEPSSGPAPSRDADDASPRPSPSFSNREPLPPPQVGTEAIPPVRPAVADRVFPIRSVISVNPAAPPQGTRTDKSDGYFHSPPGVHARRPSANRKAEHIQQPPTPSQSTVDNTQASTSSTHRPSRSDATDPTMTTSPTRTSVQQSLHDIVNDTDSTKSTGDSTITAFTDRVPSVRAPSIKSNLDETGPLVTARFKHVVSEGGHAIITGRDGETLQRCEDEPIHIPGAVQGFGLLIALEEEQEGKLIVRVVSENSKRLIGYTPRQLFALESFTDILSEEQTDNLLDHVDFIRDDEADVVTNGPEVFTISIRTPQRKNQKFWCAMHINERNSDLIICEFEMEDDPVNPLVPSNEMTPEPPEDTLDSRPTNEEFLESTQNTSKPLRVLRSARKRKGEAAAMEVFNIMSQVQEQLAAAPNLDRFLKTLVGVVKELTGFHRVMVYQFDHNWNGRVVTELVDPRATKDLYKGLNFPASDIPKQARELYKINKVRMLYDRDQETARLVCRTVEDLETPLDLTYSYLRAMSPIHLKYLRNMAVRSSMSISINAFEELWGLIACHSYGSKGMRVSFPIRKMCRLVGDSASRNIERLSYASRLQARKLINTVPTQSNPSGYIIASSEDLLKLFDADFGLLSIRDETKILGHMEQSQEALAMLEYLRMRCITSVMTSQDIKEDFPDLRYPPGFTEIAGLLLVPLSVGGQDFIVFFRTGQLREVKWAGNPYEKFIKEGTEGYLEPRKSFRTWSETVVGKCREWTEEEIETAAVLCLVYGKFIEVWRQKEAALQSSQLTRLLLANSAHEVRTPLNAIINYLEIALEGSLDQETRDNLAKSHSASKSLIYVINDLLDLTKTEEGGDLVKDEVFDLSATLYEATDMFKGDVRRKNLSYEVTHQPGLPSEVVGDQRRIRQAISNVTANAIQNTTQGGIKVEMHVTSRGNSRVDVEVSVTDTGVGMSAKKLDALFRELEQVQTEQKDATSEPVVNDRDLSAAKEGGETLGLGLAVVARIIRNMNGQLRLKSEEGKGSRFVMQFPFDLPQTEGQQQGIEAGSSHGSATPHAELAIDRAAHPIEGMLTLIERGGSSRRNSSEGRRTPHFSRSKSNESVHSKKSFGSIGSVRSALSKSSNMSNKSEADRLIEAIQEPHRVEGWHDNKKSLQRSNSGDHARPGLEKRHSFRSTDQTGSPVKSHATSSEVAPVPEARDQRLSTPGQSDVTDQGQPIRPIRVPGEYLSSPTAGARPISSPPAMAAFTSSVSSSTPATQRPKSPTDASHMRVLVAEDDPVNSRIIKKRLERLGHDVTMTVNGEECSSTYCDKAGFFDIVLMDMQMPIVDGLTSAKLIRSHEKTHPTHSLSTRAAMNGRVPIIAVSASLVEKQRHHYVSTGFDGWILKPILFQRLQEIMEGTVDQLVRKENIYQPGSWERGGWFEQAPQDIFTANTKPSEQPPQTAPSQSVQLAATTDDPHIKEDDHSIQTQEQQRLLEAGQEIQSDDPPADDTHEESKLSD